MAAAARVQISRAVRSDAEAIAAVLLAAFQEFESLYTPAGFRATTPSSQDVALRLDEGPTWIAKSGERVIGTVSAQNRNDEVYIRSMAVLPDARGTGVGAQLLAVVHAYAVGSGARRLSLATTPFLAAAIRLYENAGFERAPQPSDLQGTPLIIMTKALR